uniref:VWFA domain-containing protein n=1 Tax=Strongyloides venezuelensis TaxID=75913 RepID=A0A0K0FHP7_STRVS
MVYSEELGYDPEEWEECEEQEHFFIFAPFTRILVATIAIVSVGFFFWILDARKEWNKIGKDKNDKKNKNDKSIENIDGRLKTNDDLSLLNSNINIVISDNKRLSDHYTTETILHSINSPNHFSNDIPNREDEKKISSDYVMDQLKRNSDSNKLGKTDSNTTKLQSSQRVKEQQTKNNIIYSNDNYPENEISNDASVSLERTYKELADKIYHNFSKQLQTDIGTIPALNDFSNYKDLANSLTEIYDKDIKQAMEDVISQGGTDIDAQNLKNKLEEHIKDTIYQHNSIDKCTNSPNNMSKNEEHFKEIDGNEHKKSSDSENGFVKIDPSDDELMKEPSDVSYEKVEFSDYNNERHSVPIFCDDDPSVELKPELETISERAAEEVNVLLQEYYEKVVSNNRKSECDYPKDQGDISEINDALKEVIKPDSPIFTESKIKDGTPDILQHRQNINDEPMLGKHYNIGVQLPQQIFDESYKRTKIYDANNVLPIQHNIDLNQKTFTNVERISSNGVVHDVNQSNYKQIDSIEIINPHKEGIEFKSSNPPDDVDMLLKDYVQPIKINDHIENSYNDEPLECINDAVVVIENFLAEATKRSPTNDLKDLDEIQCLRQPTPTDQSFIPIKNGDIKIEGKQKNVSQYDDLVNKATADIYLQDAIDYVETQKSQPQKNNFIIEEDMLEKVPNNEFKHIIEASNNLTHDATSNIVKTNDVFEKVDICLDEIDDTITYAPEIQSLEIPPDQLSLASEHVTDNNIESLLEDNNKDIEAKITNEQNVPFLGETIPPDATLTRRDHSKSPIQIGFGEAPKIRKTFNARNDDVSSITSRSEAKRRKSQSSLLSALGVTSTQEMLLRLTSLDQLSAAMKKAGLESTNLIFGIDYTASNKYQGENSFDGKNLHTIDNEIENPYQKVIKVMGKTLAPFATQKGIPVYGFGDATTGDWSVFKIRKDRECRNLDEVLEAYNNITPDVNLSGPTNFAPLIHQAMEICAYYKEYFILVIIADGQVTNEKATRRAIVQACNFPLSIIVVGVGDGPWEMMKVFDESLPKRPWDNFHFVEFHDIIRKKANTNEGELSFAIHSLLEIPDQYNYIRRVGLLRRNDKQNQYF